MDSELWSRFPSEIFPTVLSFLSVPVLYRFQAVSKTWNSLIRSNHFITLHIQNSTGRHSYILGRSADSQEKRLPRDFCDNIGWRLLDVKEKRWYFFKNILGFDRSKSLKRRRSWYYIHHSSANSKHVRPDRFEFCSHATDGNLMCDFYMYPYVRGAEGNMVVNDPIAWDFEILPASPYNESWRMHSVTNLVVDNTTREFKLFAMRWELDESGVIPCLVVYDSATDLWHLSSTNLARLIKPGTTTRLQVRCTVFLKGFLYVVITSFYDGPWEDWPFWQVWRYSPVEDTWTDTGFASKKATTTLLHHPQLIESDDRLFLASWVTVPGAVKSFEIVEIGLSQRDMMRLEDKLPNFRVPHQEMEYLFKTTLHAGLQVYLRNDGACNHSPEVAAFGMGKSIGMIAKSSGVSMLIDLETRELSPWMSPARPCDDELWFGQPTDLILHPHFFKCLRERRRAKQVVIELSDDSE